MSFSLEKVIVHLSINTVANSYKQRNLPVVPQICCNVEVQRLIKIF